MRYLAHWRSRRSAAAGASALRLWAGANRLQKRNCLDNNPGYRVAGVFLLGKRRAKALRQAVTDAPAGEPQ